MKYERFEDLPVWKAAVDLYIRVDAIAKHDGFRRQGDLLNQLQRAALSVSNNIAEGFELGTTSQLITFLYTARGSAGEVRSILCVMERMAGFGDLKSEISNLKLLAEGISRQLRGWAEHLQNTEIKGTRYLNDASREQLETKARADRFREKLKQMVDESRQLREDS